jgi:hypothetical protein
VQAIASITSAAEMGCRSLTLRERIRSLAGNTNAVNYHDAVFG